MSPLATQRIAQTPRWATDELWRKARAVPSLDLRFADNKSLVDATTGQNLVTFSRASGGTYVDSQGVIRTALDNEPRFNHNPSTGESLGLLVEEARTNLLTNSELTDTGFLKLRSSINSDVEVSPSGLLTADKIVEDSSASTTHYLYRYSTIAADTTYTYSVFLKAAERSFALIGFGNNIESNGVRVGVDLASGTIGTPFNFGSGSGATASIQAFGNGWYRVALSGKADASSTAGLCTVYLATSVVSSGTPSYTGDGTSGIYIWGAQLEAGAFPTSYIKTEAATATRAADVASITTLGANVRSLFSQFRSPASGTRPIVSLDDNTANERIDLFTSGTDPKLLVTDGGVAQADLDAGTIAANTTARLAARFTTNDFAASVSGGASVTDTSGTMPTVDRIRIGRDQAGNYLNGHIARLAGWNEPLPMLPPVTQ